jgi:predicted nucleotidyltransferase
MTTPVDNKDNATRRILAARERLASLGVRSIGLFGSFVRGQQGPSSDVDLLVEFAPDKHSFDNFMDVSFLLEDILGRKVEVVTPDALSPYLGPHILREVEHVLVAA